MKTKKNLLVGMIAILLIAAISVGGTLAWVTWQGTAADDGKTVDFTAAKISASLDDAKKGTLTGLLAMVPSTYKSLAQFVKNDGDVTEFIRLKVMYVDSSYNLVPITDIFTLASVPASSWVVDGTYVTCTVAVDKNKFAPPVQLEVTPLATYTGKTPGQLVFIPEATQFGGQTYTGDITTINW